MSYSFAPHLATLRTARSNDATGRLYALVDVAQLPGARRAVERVIGAEQYRLLFAGCFAESAMSLSPLLIELPAPGEAALSQISALDNSLKSLPVLGVLLTAMTLDELTRHLQSLLIIETDESPYLLRLADTQMLAAFNATLEPAQRARLFYAIDNWWTVDHNGTLIDFCNGRDAAQSLANLPLQLTADQTSTLLTAVIVPTLASQLRNLNNAFATTLTTRSKRVLLPKRSMLRGTLARLPMTN